MQRYALLDDKNNVFNIVVWDEVSVWQAPVGAVFLPSGSPVQIGWRYYPETQTFLKLAGSTDPTQPIRKMAKIDFMRLFTVTEMVRYKMLRMQVAALTPADYVAAMSGNAQKMMLVQADVMFDRFDLASELEMEHAETIQGVQMMGQAGIFGNPATDPDVTVDTIAERVEQILAGLMPGHIAAAG